MVRSGPMRHSITIEQRSTARNGSGEQFYVWSTFATRRASVDRSAGKEIAASGSTQGRVPTVWRIRYLDGVQPKMRVRFGTTLYNIQSVHDPSNGFKEELLLACDEWVEATS